MVVLTLSGEAAAQDGATNRPVRVDIRPVAGGDIRLRAHAGDLVRPPADVRRVGVEPDEELVQQAQLRQDGTQLSMSDVPVPVAPVAAHELQVMPVTTFVPSPL